MHRSIHPTDRPSIYPNSLLKRTYPIPNPGSRRLAARRPTLKRRRNRRRVSFRRRTDQDPARKVQAYAGEQGDQEYAEDYEKDGEVLLHCGGRVVGL